MACHATEHRGGLSAVPFQDQRSDLGGVLMWMLAGLLRGRLMGLSVGWVQTSDLIDLWAVERDFIEPG
jgi:hypothetical protein